MKISDIDEHLQDAYKMIGNKIVMLRRRMSQNDLAKRAKVSRATISAIEQGRAISLKNLIKITVALDIRLEVFFMISPPSYNVPINIPENNMEELMRLLSRVEYLLQSKK